MNHRFFFVVGAAKAGTTSVHEYLKQHPEVFVHDSKDIACFFCEQYGLPLTLGEFRTLMCPLGMEAQFKVYGDICASYLSDPKCADRIATTFPEARILVILRDPAERAFSLYQWMVREGLEHAPSFENALELESNRLDRQMKGSDLIAGSKDDYLYFHTGLYSRQLQRFFDRFPREHILIMKYDDLRDHPAEFMKDIYSFLGVSTAFVPSFKIHNRARLPASAGLQYFCRRKLARIAPASAVRLLMSLNLRANQMLARKLELNTATRAALVAKYGDDIRVTERMTGLSLCAWRK